MILEFAVPLFGFWGLPVCACFSMLMCVVYLTSVVPVLLSHPHRSQAEERMAYAQTRAALIAKTFKGEVRYFL